MKSIKFIGLIIISLLLISNTEAQTKRKKTTKKKMSQSNSTKKNTPPQVEVPLEKGVADANIQPKVIYTQNNCGVENPFVFVAHDRETYAAVQKKMLSATLAPDAIDFTKNAVVVVYLGTKPTPGYGVSFKNSGNAIQVAETVPSSGAMVMQVLTNPCAAALVPLAEDHNLQIEISSKLKEKAENFQVVKGELVQSGGLVAIEKKIQIEGTIALWQMEDVVTMIFNVSGKGAENGRKMQVIASGLKQKDGTLLIQKIESNGLIEYPAAPLKATGILKGNTLSLNFEALPSSVADGFVGSGKLEAVKK